MRRGLLILAAVATATTTACGGGEVAVQAQLQGETAGTGQAEAVALSTLPIQLLPYDRDALFDSLAQAYPEPEPRLPDSVFQLQQRVGDLQREWREAEGRWGLLRDSLQSMVERMNALDPGSGEYFALFQDFGDLESEVNALRERSEEAFSEFTQLQEQLTAESQEIRLARETWAADAFAPIDSIIAVRLDERGIEELADTTSAQGVARFPSVPAGEWWVYARYDRQFDELYWNEPIEVGGGEEVVVRLTEENAEVRQKL